MFNLMSFLNIFGGKNGFTQKLNAFGQQFNMQNNCTPEQKVYQMIQSGQMSQDQFEQFSEIATQLTGRRPF